MELSKLAEKHLDTLDTITVKPLPLALGLVIGYLFAPDAFQKLLLGLDPAHACAGIWVFAVIVTSVRLRTLIALEVLSADKAAAQTMRVYPSLSNPFYESGSTRLYNLADLHGPVVMTAMSLLLLVLGGGVVSTRERSHRSCATTVISPFSTTQLAGSSGKTATCPCC